jgi:hypothetical protein
MADSSFNIGGVEGQIALLNTQMANKIETASFTGTKTFSNVIPGSLVFICRGINNAFAMISPTNEVTMFATNSYVTITYDGTTQVLSVENSSGIAFEATVLRP